LPYNFQTGISAQKISGIGFENQISGGLYGGDRFRLVRVLDEVWDKGGDHKSKEFKNQKCKNKLLIVDYDEDSKILQQKLQHD
jgi:hypothetical protein